MTLLASAALFIVGVWAIATMVEAGADHDPSEVVIDEVVGQMIALMPLSFAAWKGDLAITLLWPGWIAAFALFRLFDILKPGPVGWADRLHTPLGVMLDDVIAGIMAALCVVLLAALSHGVLGA